MKKIKFLLSLLSLSVLPITSVMSCNLNSNNQKNREKENLIKDVEKEMRITLNNYNQFFKIFNTDSYALINFLEKKYIANIKNQISLFYEENYSKLQNEDLRKFYQNWKKILKENNFLNYELLLNDRIDFNLFLVNIDVKLIFDLEENAINISYYNNSIEKLKLSLKYLKDFNKNDFETMDLEERLNWLKDNYISLYQSIFGYKIISISDALKEAITKINHSFDLYKEDAWLVVDREDLVDTSNYSFDNISPFYRRNGIEDTHWIINEFYELANEYELNKDSILIDWRNKDKYEDTQNLSNEEWNEIINKGNEIKQKALNIFKNSIGSIISKKWDLEKVVKALSKYLIIKNDYEHINSFKAGLFITLENEVSNFLCRGYSKYMYIALKLLGFENAGFESNYWIVNENRDLEHVNNIYTINGKTYVIDVTFADKFRQKDYVLKNGVVYRNKTDRLIDYESVNKNMEKFILVPMNDYLNHVPGSPLEVHYSYDDKTIYHYE